MKCLPYSLNTFNSALDNSLYSLGPKTILRSKIDCTAFTRCISGNEEVNETFFIYLSQFIFPFKQTELFKEDLCNSLLLFFIIQIVF